MRDEILILRKCKIVEYISILCPSILALLVFFFFLEAVMFADRWECFTCICLVDVNSYNVLFPSMGPLPSFFSSKFLKQNYIEVKWGRREVIVFCLLFLNHTERSKLGSTLILSTYKRARSSCLTFLDSIYKGFCI